MKSCIHIYEGLFGQGVKEMTECKFCREERTLGILHEICTNEDLRQINHADENKSENKDLHCRGTDCGKFERIKENNEGSK